MVCTYTEPALEAEFLRRLNQKFYDCKLSIRRAGADGLSVFGGILSNALTALAAVIPD
ncbi:DinI family protein [Klebsiella sp. CTHL.F3a]|uniref:DinI-like family protein n=1 Tax=Klebsiella sp. CTHL.F3a TaxID=2873296 RepID=UPI001CA6525C|nr:DinI-like family protein [Klebsiella sp. CTHL.F3a]QZY82794.1 DinI family protein [Klebsiella sp. CTHL.F3a]